MRVRSRLAVIVTVATAMLVASVSAVWAQTEDRKGGVVSTVLPGDPASIEQYWVADGGRRMLEAREMTLPAVTTSFRGTVAPSATDAAGPAFVMTGSAGGRRPSLRVLPQVAAAPGDDAGLTAGIFPFSFTRYRLFPNTEAMYKTYPYRTVGKLFFSLGTSNFVCSASVVTSFNYSVVWTAGHCVYTPGEGFHSNFLFVPAQRRNGLTPVSPYGNWTAFTAAVLSVWTTGLLEYDHGVLVMNRNASTGLTIGETVGMLGFMANAPRRQHWHLAGYPAAPHAPPSVNPQFTGYHHELCAAAWATDDKPTGGDDDPPTIGLGCDQTGGTSGGPWVVDLNALAVSSTASGTPVALNLLNGNNSYRYTGPAPNTQHLYGPYFSNGAIVLRSFAENIDVP